MNNAETSQLLNVSIDGEAIVIRLPFDALRHAVENCPDLEEVDDEGDFAPPIVTDLPAFAKDVVTALGYEEEDGTTPVHRLFDEAFVAAIEAGSAAIEIYGNVDYAAAVARAKSGG